MMAWFSLVFHTGRLAETKKKIVLQPTDSADGARELS